MGEDQRFATVKVKVSGTEWKKYTATITSPRTEANGALRIFLAGDKATTDVEHISLFPTDTWKGRENGMRKDHDAEPQDERDQSCFSFRNLELES